MYFSKISGKMENVIRLRIKSNFYSRNSIPTIYLNTMVPKPGVFTSKGVISIFWIGRYRMMSVVHFTMRSIICQLVLIFRGKVPVFYYLMKKFKSLNFYQKNLSLILTHLDQIQKKKFGKNLVFWIFSLNSKKQGLYR